MAECCAGNVSEGRGDDAIGGAGRLRYVLLYFSLVGGWEGQKGWDCAGCATGLGSRRGRAALDRVTIGDRKS
jgi:hypothetical protein